MGNSMGSSLNDFLTEGGSLDDAGAVASGQGKALQAAQRVTGAPDPERIDDDAPEWHRKDFKNALRLSDMPADFQSSIQRAYRRNS